MTTKLRTRILPLSEEWFHLIPQMIRSWFHPDVWPLTIFSCPGYADFLRENLKVPAEQRSQIFHGAFCGGRLAGFAEWRRQEDSLLLNNIYVSPGNRGEGLGCLLIEAGKTLAEEAGLPALVLDVFTWEPKTVQWYRDMGFRMTHRRHWHTGANPFSEESGASSDKFGDRRSGAFILEDFPQAEANHKAYGFSSFEARTGSGIHHVGRLHQRYFRLYADETELDPDLLAGLAMLDPGRRLLVISPNSRWLGKVALDPVCTSIRLSLELALSRNI